MDWTLEDDMSMEMPTPCQHCGKIFDLNDGYESNKWYENTVICESCFLDEEAEIEEDERWEQINDDICNALYFDEEDLALLSDRITESSKKLISEMYKHINNKKE